MTVNRCMQYARVNFQVFCEMNREGGNMPTDHGDGLKRDTKEMKTIKTSFGNGCNDLTRSPGVQTYQDFKCESHRN